MPLPPIFENENNASDFVTKSMDRGLGSKPYLLDKTGNPISRQDACDRNCRTVGNGMGILSIDAQGFTKCTCISQDIAGGSSKQYIKTDNRHTDKSGVTRIVYVKNGVKYIKKKSPKTGKYIHHRI